MNNITMNTHRVYVNGEYHDNLHYNGGTEILERFRVEGVDVTTEFPDDMWGYNHSNIKGLVDVRCGSYSNPRDIKDGFYVTAFYLA